ncbi:type 1 glutamine amidotransferase domain-containing protein [Ilumatobacter coccineus]|uniref:Peptidase C56 family protein n=1 Tax=Ilumatobacter coccineus (strain NBRC 103263 / KCTC 29153 / YM16-304) TaxID=1313172 RepID=A0A6C7EG43_ILUCY|nr:type 1 glutamine amidotransferase domain-containing protein [Ilumatobacter coccineus]BAN03558.1 peptidase C56 family protein [Ilumatobacter coccineus YM16-304]
MSNNTSAEPLNGKTIAFVTANEGVEQVELTKPWDAIEQAGGTPVLVAIETGDVQGFDHLDKADVFQATVATSDADVRDYDALVLPGGVANPDALRMDEAALRFITSFFDAGKPVAAICHAPWTLVEAGLVDGRRLTSWSSLRTDIENAGGEWVDEEVVVCTHGSNSLITSRNPDDLPAFNTKIVSVFSSADS